MTEISTRPVGEKKGGHFTVYIFFFIPFLSLSIYIYIVFDIICTRMTNREEIIDRFRVKLTVLFKLDEKTRVTNNDFNRFR